MEVSKFTLAFSLAGSALHARRRPQNVASLYPARGMNWLIESPSQDRTLGMCAPAGQRRRRRLLDGDPSRCVRNRDGHRLHLIAALCCCKAITYAQTSSVLLKARHKSKGVSGWLRRVSWAFFRRPSFTHTAQPTQSFCDAFFYWELRDAILLKIEHPLHLAPLAKAIQAHWKLLIKS